MNPILLTIMLSIIGAVGDYFLKRAGNGSVYVEWRWFFVGMFIYALTAFGWFYVMKHIKLSSLGIIYTLSTIALLVFMGTVFFNERLNVFEIAGLVAAVIAIVLLGRFA